MSFKINWHICVLKLNTGLKIGQAAVVDESKGVY